MIRRPLRVGDVVYAEGASAIIGDVLRVGELDEFGLREVEVAWRANTTTEVEADDEPELWFAPEGTDKAGTHCECGAAYDVKRGGYRCAF